MSNIQHADYTDNDLREFLENDLAMTPEMCKEIIDNQDIFRSVMSAGYEQIQMSDEDFDRCIRVIRDIANPKSDLDAAYERAMSGV